MFGMLKQWGNRQEVKAKKLKTVNSRMWTRRISWMTNAEGQVKLKMEVVCVDELEQYKEVLASQLDAEKVWQRFKDGQSINDCCSILTQPVPQSMQSRKASRS
jgi:hypothetical protein